MPFTPSNPDTIPDNMTASDGVYELAFVTDVGQLKDKSFNQGTWNGVKGDAYQNSKSYKYYQPANGDQATDDDRIDAMKAASYLLPLSSSGNLLFAEGEQARQRLAQSPLKDYGGIYPVAENIERASH